MQSLLLVQITNNACKKETATTDQFNTNNCTNNTYKINSGKYIDEAVHFISRFKMNLVRVL